FADLGMELAIGNFANFPWLALPQNGGLIAARAEVSIQAVVREVRLTLDEPPRMGWLPFEYGLERLLPVDLFSAARAPELLRILFRFFVKAAIVLHAFNVSSFRKLLRRWKNPALNEN